MRLAGAGATGGTIGWAPARRPPGRTSTAAVAAVVALLLGASLLPFVQRLTDAPAADVPPADAVDSLDDLPAADAASIQAQIAAAAYHFVPGGSVAFPELGDGAVVAGNPTAGVDATISGAGLRVNAIGDTAQRVDIAVAGLGRDGAVVPLPAPTPVRTTDTTATIQRGPVVEWYRNDTGGLEQGWTIGARPAGTGTLDLTLRVDGAAAGLSPLVTAEDTVSFVDQAGAVRGTYGSLKVTDADGTLLASRFEQAAGGVRIVVDDTDAAYPVVVDPLIAWGGAFQGGPNAALDRFGTSVAAEGDWMVVGAPRDRTADGPFQGSVYVYYRDGGTWGLVDKLSVTGYRNSPTQGPGLGDAVDLDVTDDGILIAAGGPFAKSVQDGPGTNSVGMIAVWRYPETSPSGNAPIGPTVVLGGVGAGLANPGTAEVVPAGVAASQFGSSVAIDGDLLVGGAPYSEGVLVGCPEPPAGLGQRMYTGLVQVHRLLDPATLTYGFEQRIDGDEPGDVITAADAGILAPCAERDRYRYFGYAVDIVDSPVADADFLVVGVPGSDNDTVPGNDIAAPEDPTFGRVAIYRQRQVAELAWELSTTLVPDGAGGRPAPAAYAGYGSSVSIWGDSLGDFDVAVGMPFALNQISSLYTGLSTGAGLVHVYDPGLGAAASQTFDGDDLGAGVSSIDDEFGRAVAWSEDGLRLAVGHPGDDTGSQNRGSVATYTRVFTPSAVSFDERAYGRNFGQRRLGSSVALGDGFLVGGSPNESVVELGLGAGHGAVRVFTDVAGSYGAPAGAENGTQLLPTGDRIGANFGAVMSRDGHLLAVTAPGDDRSPSANKPGTVFVFEGNGISWVLRATLAPSVACDVADGVSFGESVAVVELDSHAFVAVGSPGDASGAGSVCLYGRSGVPQVGTWSTLLKLSDAGAAAFGDDVAFTGDGTLLVGAPSTDLGAGALYRFENTGTLAQWQARPAVTAASLGLGADARLGATVVADGRSVAVSTGEGGTDPALVVPFTDPEGPDQPLVAGQPVNPGFPAGVRLVIDVHEHRLAVATPGQRGLGIWAERTPFSGDYVLEDRLDAGSTSFGSEYGVESIAFARGLGVPYPALVFGTPIADVVVDGNEAGWVFATRATVDPLGRIDWTEPSIVQNGGNHLSHEGHLGASLTWDQDSGGLLVGQPGNNAISSEGAGAVWTQLWTPFIEQELVPSLPVDAAARYGDGLLQFDLNGGAAGGQVVLVSAPGNLRADGGHGTVDVFMRSGLTWVNVARLPESVTDMAVIQATSPAEIFFVGGNVFGNEPGNGGPRTYRTDNGVDWERTYGEFSSGNPSEQAAVDHGPAGPQVLTAANVGAPNGNLFGIQYPIATPTDPDQLWNAPFTGVPTSMVRGSGPGGDYVAVGVPGEAGGVGRVHVFHRSPTDDYEFELAFTLDRPVGVTASEFGHDLAVGVDGQLLVSAPGAPLPADGGLPPGQGSGRIVAFDQNAGGGFDYVPESAGILPEVSGDVRFGASIASNQTGTFTSTMRGDPGSAREYPITSIHQGAPFGRVASVAFPSAPQPGARGLRPTGVDSSLGNETLVVSAWEAAGGAAYAHLDLFATAAPPPTGAPLVDVSVPLTPVPVGVSTFPTNALPTSIITNSSAASAAATSATFGDVDIEAAAVGDVGEQGPVASFPLDTIALHELPDGALAILAQVPLTELPVAGGWQSILDGTALAGVPLQNVTLDQVLADPVARPRFDQLDLGSLDLGATPLAGLPVSTLALAGLPLDDLPLSTSLAAASQAWCDAVTAQGFTPADLGLDCHNAQIDLLALALQGVNLATTPVGGVRLLDLNLDGTPVGGVRLLDMRLDGTPVGGVRLLDLDVNSLPVGGVRLLDLDAGAIPLTDSRILDMIPGYLVDPNVPPTATPVGGVRLLDMNLSGLPVGGVRLLDLNLAGTPVGGVRLLDLGPGVMQTIVDCAKPGINCSDPDLTLDDALAADAVRGTATFNMLRTSPVGGVRLLDLDIAGTPVGGVRLLDLPAGQRNLVVDCSNPGIDCASANSTLSDALAAGAIRIGATLGMLRTSPVGGVRLLDLDLQGSPVGGVRLLDLPLSAIPVGGVRLLSFDQFTSIPVGGVRLLDLDMRGTPVGGVRLLDLDLQGSPVGGVRLLDLPLSAIPVGGVRLLDFDVAGTPVGGVRLLDLDLQGSPVGGVRLLQLDPNMLQSVVDCSKIDCEDPSVTVGAAAAAGALRDGSQLHMLQSSPVGGVRLLDLGLASSPVGGVRLLQLQPQQLAAVVDCSKPGIDCDNPAATLAQALAAGAIRSSAVLQDLTSSPVGGVRLLDLNLVDSPVGGVRLLSLAPDAVTRVADCSLVDCTNARLTMADVVRAGALLPTARLSDIMGTPVGGVRLLDLIRLFRGVFGEQDVRDALAAQQFLELRDLLSTEGIRLADLPIGDAHLDGATLADIWPGLATLTFQDLADAVRKGSASIDVRGAIDQLATNTASGYQTLRDLDSTEGITLSAIPDTALATGEELVLRDLAGAFAGLRLSDLRDVIEKNADTFYTAEEIKDALDAQLPNATLGETDQFGGYGSLTLGELAESLRRGGDTTTVAQIVNAIFGENAKSLTLLDLLLSILSRSQGPWDHVDVTALTEGAPDVGTRIPVNVAFAAVGGFQPNLRLRVTLPPGVRYVPGSAYTVPAVAGSPVEPRVQGNVLTYDHVNLPAGLHTLQFDVRPTTTLGLGEVEATVTLGDASASDRATLNVVEALEPNDTADTATLLEPDTIYLSHISTGTDVDLYYFDVGPAGSPIPVGSRAALVLSNLDADLDLTLYSPFASSAALGNASGEHEEPVPDDSDGVIPGSMPTPPTKADDLTRPRGLTDVALYQASVNRGTRDERVDTASLFRTGRYFVAVTGYNGAVSRAPYSLRLRVVVPPALPPCSARTFAAPAGAAPAALPAVDPDANTVIVTNLSRYEALYGSTAAQQVRASLDAFLASPVLAERGIRPTVVPVDADPAGAGAELAAAYGAWDAAPCFPETTNPVVGEILQAVAPYRTPAVRHVVLLGGDDVLPMARVPDLTERANEAGYVGTIGRRGPDGTITTMDAASGPFHVSHFLTDDAYGDPTPLGFGDRAFFVPEVAVGRLVETPGEIAAALDDYIAADGLLEPDTALSTGYDFLTDAGTAIGTSIETLLGIDVDTLLTEDWTVEDLHEALFATSDAPDLASVNAHYDHQQILPGQGNLDEKLRLPAETYTVASALAALVDAPDALQGTLGFSIGCHSGLNVSDLLAGATLGADWAQTLTGNGGVWVGNTGYGYGSGRALALSERLMAEFAERLDGSMSIGQALAFAKQHYAAELVAYGVYDEKVLMEATFYGLPFYELDVDTPAPGPAYHPPQTTVDPFTGLTTATVGIDSDAQPVIVDGEGTYWAEPDPETGAPTGIQFTHGRPIQPRTSVEVTQDGLVAHGILVTPVRSHDVDDVDPVEGDPTFTNVGEQPGTLSGEVVFPTAPANVNALVDGDGAHQVASVITGQFASDGVTTTGRQRLYDELEGVVYYTDPAATDWDAPVFHTVDGVRTEDDGQQAVTFTVEVGDGRPAGEGVLRVVVAFVEDPGAADSSWHTVDLARTPGTDRWTGTATVAADEIEFYAQAVDDSGNVGVTTNKALNFRQRLLPEPAPVAGLTTHVGGTATGGWYTTPAVVTADAGGSLLQVRVDNGPWQVLGANGVEVTTDGSHQVTVRAADGRESTEHFKIDRTGPRTAIGTPVAGGVYPRSGPSGGHALFASFACPDPGSGATSCLAEIAYAGGPFQPVTATDDVATVAGTHVLRVTAGPDQVGNQAGPPTEVTFTVVSPPSIDDVIVAHDDTGSTVTATWTAGGAGGPYTATVTWSDGTTRTCSTAPGAPDGCEVTAPDGETPGTVSASHTFTGPGPRTAQVTVTDRFGSFDQQAAAPRAPELPSVDPVSVRTGAPFTLGVPFTDPDSETWSAAVDYGDGLVEHIASVSPPEVGLVHVFGEAGDHEVTVTVTDDGGLSGSTTFLVTVVDPLAPVVTIDQPTLPGTAGQPVAFGGSFTDADDSAGWTATVLYGDGASGEPTLDGGTFTGTHTYAVPGTYELTVEVCDVLIACGTATVPVVVHPVNTAPVVDAGDDVTIDEGDTIARIVHFVDADPPSTSWTATADFGAGPVDLGPVHDGFELSHAFTALGDHTVTVTVCDDGLLCGSDSFVVHVEAPNQAPVLDAADLGPAVLTLGDTLHRDVHFSDPDSSSWTVTVAGGTPTTQTSTTASVSVTPTVAGEQQVLVEVCDDEHACTSATITVVARAANSVPVVLAGADATVLAGTPFTRTATFTDGDGSTHWTATVDYGTGAGPAVATVDQSTRTVALSHTFATPGTYPVTVVVCDDGDPVVGSPSQCGQAVVNVTATDPNVAPVVDAGSSVTIGVGDTLVRAGSFVDTTSTGWTATVDYGDGTTAPLVLTPSKTFTLSHPYTTLGARTVTVTVTDDGGLVGTATFTVTVADRTAPVVAAAVTPAPNLAGWHRTDVVVHWTATDPAPSSGGPTQPADTTVTAQGAGQVVTSGQSCDAAGNCGVGTATVSIDKTAPGGTVTGLVGGLLGKQLNGTATDGLSGVASVTVSYSPVLLGTTTTVTAAVSCNAARTSCSWTAPLPAGLGVYVAKATVTDLAGNTYVTNSLNIQVTLGL